MVRSGQVYKDRVVARLLPSERTAMEIVACEFGVVCVGLLSKRHQIKDQITIPKIR